MVVSLVVRGVLAMRSYEWLYRCSVEMVDLQFYTLSMMISKGPSVRDSYYMSRKIF